MRQQRAESGADDVACANGVDHCAEPALVDAAHFDARLLVHRAPEGCAFGCERGRDEVELVVVGERVHPEWPRVVRSERSGTRVQQRAQRRGSIDKPLGGDRIHVDPPLGEPSLALSAGNLAGRPGAHVHHLVVADHVHHASTYLHCYVKLGMGVFRRASPHLPETPGFVICEASDEGVLTPSVLVDGGHVAQDRHAAIGVSRTHLDLRIRERVRNVRVEPVCREVVGPRSNEHAVADAVFALADKAQDLACAHASSHALHGADEDMPIVPAVVTVNVHAQVPSCNCFKALVGMLVAVAHSVQQQLSGSAVELSRPAERVVEIGVQTTAPHVDFDHWGRACADEGMRGVRDGAALALGSRPRHSGHVALWAWCLVASALVETEHVRAVCCAIWLVARAHWSFHRAVWARVIHHHALLVRIILLVRRSCRAERAWRDEQRAWAVWIDGAAVLADGHNADGVGLE